MIIYDQLNIYLFSCFNAAMNFIFFSVTSFDSKVDVKAVLKDQSYGPTTAITAISVYMCTLMQMIKELCIYKAFELVDFFKLVISIIIISNNLGNP